MNPALTTKLVPIRATGVRRRLFLDALDFLETNETKRVPSSHGELPEDREFLFPCPLSLYNAAVEAAAGSVDVAELTLGASAIDTIIAAAARLRAGIPTNQQN